MGVYDEVKMTVPMIVRYVHSNSKEKRNNIHLDDHHGRVYVTCCANEVYNENCVVPTFKQSSVCVMVWGCIMEGRKGPLVVLKYPGGQGGGMTG
jgi:hypothetical protein